MKDERIREIARESADNCNMYADGYCARHSHIDLGGCEGGIAEAIRLALAERDREVAEWAKQEEETVIHLTRDEIFQAVGYQAILAFLEAQP